jgi:hypothetical protein
MFKWRFEDTGGFPSLSERTFFRTWSRCSSGGLRTRGGFHLFQRGPSFGQRWHPWVPISYRCNVSISFREDLLSDMFREHFEFTLSLWCFHLFQRGPSFGRSTGASATTLYNFEVSISFREDLLSDPKDRAN